MLLEPGSEASLGLSDVDLHIHTSPTKGCLVCVLFPANNVDFQLH